MRDFLKEVLLEKQKSLKETKRVYPEDELRMKLEEPRERRDFKSAICAAGGGLAVIGEIKKASPSEGLLRERFDPVQIARFYENGGCAAVSILTEEKFFQGKISYLNQVKKVIKLPVLRKDFIFEKYQLYESRFFGADACLLIAEVFKGDELSDFLMTAKNIELDCLVEVRGLSDLDYALKQGAEIIGINNRNLHSLQVDSMHAKKIISAVPEGRIIVVESGIKTRREFLQYQRLKVNALLIGSLFMKAQDIKTKIKEITHAARPLKSPKKRQAKRKLLKKKK